MSITDDKKQLRRELIQRRRNIPDDVRAFADARIFERLLPLLEQCSGVFTYVSTEIEVDTRRLMRWCFEQGKAVAVPVSGDSELTFYPIKSFDDLAVGRFNILEPMVRNAPAVPDRDSLCIVPALCCDRSGLRLGYGRGYYDRFLAGFPGKSAIICYSDFVMEVPAEPHDRRADIVVTDQGIAYMRKYNG